MEKAILIKKFRSIIRHHLILFIGTVLMCSSVCLPVFAGENGIIWENLSLEQQKILKPFKDKWDTFPVEKQQSLYNGSKKWIDMSPSARATLLKRIDEWDKLPAERKASIQKGFQQYNQLTDSQKEKYRTARKRILQLSIEPHKDNKMTQPLTAIYQLFKGGAG